MSDHPSPTSPAPLPSAGPPPALDSFRDDGWTISGSPAVWTATRIRGSASRVIAANTAPELLEKLIAAAVREAEVTEA
jgi:hypothetical protein